LRGRLHPEILTRQYPDDGDQQADNRTGQSRPRLESMDLSKQESTIASSEIAGDYVGRASLNPTSDG
jgi:hypothetical protein